jgi:hypothetical protein
MGFEDEVEQPIGRPCRQTNGRSKRPNELTSSIVPRGTSYRTYNSRPLASARRPLPPSSAHVRLQGRSALSMAGCAGLAPYLAGQAR